MTRQNDTRNNWITMMFVCKARYQCLRKQTVMDDCTTAFKELESYGFEFKEIGYGGNHVHFLVDVPSKYSVTTAIIMVKSRSSKRLFEKHPNFRKRYPRGSFWSGYEHHESTGRKDMRASAEYIRSQQKHHGVKVINDRKKRLEMCSADQDTATTLSVAE